MQSVVSKLPLCKAVAFAAGLGLAVLSCPVHAVPASSGDTVQGLYDALLGTMKNGRILGQSGRFTQLEPVIRRSFDIASMARKPMSLRDELIREANSSNSNFYIIDPEGVIDGVDIPRQTVCRQLHL